MANENPGERAGLLAGGALMIDYLLNVAVGISAGVGAVVSAVPALDPYTFSLCLGVLTVLTVVNLRGTREPGVLFVIPTYVLIACSTVGYGLWRSIASGGHPVAVVAPPQPAKAMEIAGAWCCSRHSPAVAPP